MVLVGGTPIVERLLRQLADAGVRWISIVVGPKGDVLVDHFAALTNLPADLEMV